MRSLWWMLALLVGCFDPVYPEGIPCSGRGTCPPGQICDVRDNICRRELSPECAAGADCDSGICDLDTGTCAPARCDDGVRNGGESDVDCGGPDCGACADGAACSRAEDCQSGACNQGMCAPERCGDGVVQDGEECDDAGASAACNGNCTRAACGDGIVNPAAGEVCDTARDACCSDSCTALAAGVVCRAAAHGCDAAETCDGSSAACPADDVAADGSECDDCAAGPGLCDQCSAGVCVDLCGNGRVDDSAGEQCDGAQDAACPGHCDQACACAFAPTCLAYQSAVPELPDGRYTIDPDGDGGLEPFEVRCDMRTDGGGWTVIEYASDLAFLQHFSGGDARRHLPQDFALVLTSEQIAAIQAHATEGFQRYVGLCDGTVHYFYTAGSSHTSAFGFRFLDGTETPSGAQSYAPFDIAVVQDGCSSNGGEGGDPARATIFDIRSPLVPVVNVSSGDNGDAGERFGAPLTGNAARLR